MGEQQRKNYLRSIKRGICDGDNEFNAYKSRLHDDAIFVTKKKFNHLMTYITLQLQQDDSLFVVVEAYASNENSGRCIRIDTGTKIDDSCVDNLIQIAEMYFAYGKGANPDNPSLGELIRTKNKTKSARTIILL